MPQPEAAPSLRKTLYAHSVDWQKIHQENRAIEKFILDLTNKEWRQLQRHLVGLRDVQKIQTKAESIEDPTELGQFFHRLSLLEPIFVELERIDDTGLEPEWWPPFLTFERKKVETILWLCFAPYLDAKSLLHDIKKLAQEKRKITRALRDLSDLDSLARLRNRLKIISDVAPLQESLSKKFGGKCPLSSAAITNLATYFLGCRPLMEQFRQAELYRYVGKIMAVMTVPTCLLCHRPHRPPNYRNIRARDIYSTFSYDKRKWTKECESLALVILPHLIFYTKNNFLPALFAHALLYAHGNAK